jgi:acetyltransferase-like isoleucine patch superfamily enzyme
MDTRTFVKAMARASATILVSPALLSYRLRAVLLGHDRALEGSSQMLSLVPGILGQYVRRAFLSRVLAHCHNTATVEFGVLFSKVGARLDENVYVGPGCHLGLVHLERDVLLSPCVHVPSGATTHGISDPTVAIRDQVGRRTLVRIGARSWIGSGAVVMADVGQDTVVGAGAVVTSPLPDRVVAGGVPAHVLKSRDEPAHVTPPQ